MENHKGLLVFGSTTGSTRILALSVKSGLADAGIPTVVRNARRAKVVELLHFPLIFFGCSTWEDGCIQKDFREFMHRWGGLRLDGIRVGVFGAGSRAYPHYCQAVDDLEHELVERGATLLGPSFRGDGSVYGLRPVVQKWANDLVGHFA
ncbi:MAG: flavodoxin-like domain-containing protein [Fibrobacteres bacterium]|nr:flavodoxin-like domain-containing protein [Fibrobacterota bacterium]